MRYALVNGEKQEASKGAKGRCLCCGADVIAKCGEIRSSHWAHKNNEECPYSQKEPKTQWHQDWQNHFPKEWQEGGLTWQKEGRGKRDRPRRQRDRWQKGRTPPRQEGREASPRPALCASLHRREGLP